MIDDFKTLAESDIKGQREEYIFPLPSFLDPLIERLINDPRDKIMVYLSVNIATIVLGGAISLFFLPPSNLYGAVYLTAAFVLFLQRYRF